MEAFLKARHVCVTSDESQSLLARALTPAKKHPTILQDVNLHINQGAHVTVFGHSGAGKTILLRALAGEVSLSSGDIRVNGHAPKKITDNPGFVTTSPLTTQTTLKQYLGGEGNNQTALLKYLGLEHVTDKSVALLSLSQQLKAKIARALLSDSPLLLLDGIADEIGAPELKGVLEKFAPGRTVIISTRFPQTAEKLDLPILLLHAGTLAHFGTCEDIASKVACPRQLDAWVSALRYDVLRHLKRHPGVQEVRLLPTDQFAGQRLRITTISSHYLPGVYDILSQTDLVRVQEVPPSLVEILAKL